MHTNQSREQEWEKCPRRYFWKYVCDLEPRNPSVKQFFGTLIHEALAAFYRKDPNWLLIFDQGLTKWEDRANTDFIKLTPVWRERLERYPERWAGEDGTFEVLMVPEQEIGLRLGAHILMTRLDLLLRRRDNGSIWVMDHKTTARTGPTWWAQFSVDKQGSAYTLAAEQLMGREVSGWIINCIKPTKEEPFERQAFSRTREQLQRFLTQQWGQISRREQLLDDFRGDLKDGDPLDDTMSQDTMFPQYTHECHGFGTCQYLSLCSVGKAAAGVFKKREPDYVDQAA